MSSATSTSILCYRLQESRSRSCLILQRPDSENTNTPYSDDRSRIRKLVSKICRWRVSLPSESNTIRQVAELTRMFLDIQNIVCADRLCLCSSQSLPVYLIKLFRHRLCQLGLIPVRAFALWTNHRIALRGGTWNPSVPASLASESVKRYSTHTVN